MNPSLNSILTGSLVLLVSACNQGPPPHRPPIVSIAPTSSALPAAPTASAASAPIASAKVEVDTEKDEPTPRHKVALTLRPGDPPCTLVFDAHLFDDHPEWFAMAAISRIATESGGACADTVFYDVEKETKQDPDDMEPQSLIGGIFRKPGQTLPADMAGDPVWNVTEDLNFDNYVDLCVVVMTGAYNYSQKCWLFDPALHSFVRHAEIDELIFMSIDHKKKRLSSSFRAGGPVYESNEYEWKKGKLVKVYSSTSVFGEKLDGSPLPAGYHYWIIRHELRNGVLVKTFDGPVRDKSLP